MITEAVLHILIQRNSQPLAAKMTHCSEVTKRVRTLAALTVMLICKSCIIATTEHFNHSKCSSTWPALEKEWFQDSCIVLHSTVLSLEWTQECTLSAWFHGKTILWGDNFVYSKWICNEMFKILSNSVVVALDGFVLILIGVQINKFHPIRHNCLLRFPKDIYFLIYGWSILLTGLTQEMSQTLYSQNSQHKIACPTHMNSVREDGMSARSEHTGRLLAYDQVYFVLACLSDFNLYSIHSKSNTSPTLGNHLVLLVFHRCTLIWVLCGPV